MPELPTVCPCPNLKKIYSKKKRQTQHFSMSYRVIQCPSTENNQPTVKEKLVQNHTTVPQTLKFFTGTLFCFPL